MTNRGVVGYPAAADASGLVTAAKLAAPVLGVLTSGYYYFTGGARATATLLTTSNRLMLSPWYVPSTVRLSVLGADVFAPSGDVGSKVRLGIYADDGTGEPGSLVLDAGVIAGDSLTVQEIAINQTLTPGLYWIGGAAQIITVTAPTVRASNDFTPTGVRMTTTPSANQTVVGVFQSSVSGALPAVFARSGILTAGLCIRTHIKVA